MDGSARPQILDDFAALADATRSRVLLLLEGRELTVTELCSVMQLPQSTVSRHLKTLGDGGWVRARADGTRRLYRLAGEHLPEPSRRLWGLTREVIAALGPAELDRLRLASVLRARRSRSEDFFAAAGARWDRMRDELFGPAFIGQGLAGLLGSDDVVGDLGCGTGAVSAALAPFVGRVEAIDGSSEMLAAARERLGDCPNVELRDGRLEALPLADGSLDAATLVLVLHHVPEPQAVLSEAGRVLRPGGRLLVVDMLPHDREEYRRDMGHVWLGFDEPRLRDWLSGAGLAARRFVPLPPHPQARGPALFALAAERPSVTEQPNPSTPRRRKRERSPR